MYIYSFWGQNHGGDPGGRREIIPGDQTCIIMFCPCGIALYNHASHGELVVVSEWGGGRVQVFKAGQVFSIYAGVQHAHHVVVDAHGSVYVTEYATRKIKRFSLDGELVGGGEWATSAVSLVAGDAGIDIVVAQQHVMRLLVGNYRKRAKYDADASM